MSCRRDGAGGGARPSDGGRTIRTKGTAGRLGQSTSLRRKWKERHGKGEFSKKQARGGKQRKKYERAYMKAFNRKK